MNAASLPSASQYSDAIQNPKLCFSLPWLREGTLALDRLGMPLVMAGNFAVVFKLRLLDGTRAVKCFCRFLGDREARYIAVDKQLDISKPSSLTGFDYFPRGILVEGKRYPILLMDWIEGPTLNVYIEGVLTKNNFRDALASLAEDWCRAVKELDDCHIAHGDLQHGNIIVTSDGIRLVDLDGTFVPGLTGRKAAELGHSHYQHPKQSEDFFDAGLDRFSSLVIYLSLLAIAERPTLWKTFHDENLIFTKQDFTDPSRSPLFQALDAMGGTVAKLARTLRQACLDDPSRSPHLSDLIAVKRSKLPSWMSSAPIVVVETKTREASTDTSRVPGIHGSPNGQPLADRQQPTTFSQTLSSTTSGPSPYPLPPTTQGPRAPYGATASIPGSRQQPTTFPQASSSTIPIPMQTQMPPLGRRSSMMDYLFANENLMMALMILYGILIFPIISTIVVLVHGGGR
jgi:serine/threonine protein kinase